MKSFPLITIGITAYNAVDTVGKAIDSSLQQDWPNFEIVIVDDVSTDNTFEVLQKLAQKHHQIRLFQNEKNLGVAGARNRIIKEARGEFIAFFDDDDKSDPARLNHQYKRIIEYRDRFNDDAPVLCYTARTQIFPNGMKRYEPTMGMNKEIIAPHGEAVAVRILIGKPSQGTYGSMATCSQMAHREVFENLRLFDETFRRGEDTDFNIRAALSGAHFIGIAEPLVTQTMTMGQEKKLDREREAELAMLEKHKDYLQTKNWYAFCRKWLEIRYDYYNRRWPSFVKRMIFLAFRYPGMFINKLIWALPATDTRRSFKKWHHAQLND